MSAPLEVQGLTKSYPSFRLEDVSFTLTEGHICGFIGRNGAGKTTTLHSLLGLLAPDSGEIQFWGQPLREDELSIRQRIGFLSAGMSFYPRKKLRTITQVTASFYPGWDGDTYRSCLERFALEEDKTPEALSNGMKIKYLLTLALSHRADLLILDEPTSGLDPISREELLEIFLRLRDEGKTILFSTHITSDLEKTADDILYISGGKIRCQAPLEEFTGSYALAEFGREPLPPETEALLLGRRRTRDGFTGLLRIADAERSGLQVRPATLDEVLIHLEKEEP